MRDALGNVQSMLVFGGGSEIGRAIAGALVRRRTRTVVLAGRDPAALAPAVDELRSAGAATVEAVAFDARALGDHGSLVDSLFERFGGFDVVLLTFGVLGDQSTSEQDERAALEVVTTNFAGTVSVAIPVVRRLRAQGHGTIVALSSVAGERPRKANYIYGASKAGMDAYLQGLTDSLAGSGVHVVVVRPGFVRTKMTAHLPASPGATTPEAVADAVVAAIGKGSGTVWVPPMLRWVMSGVRHLPRPVFRRLKV